ncbi:MAG: DUF58 domain-containing protein [Vicinamibacterales bacterium]|nr:DUF58 domain-containing protein [Vicinamibacterales bacterium]
MRTRAEAWAGRASEAPLVSLSDISEIELVIVKRMRALTMGEHRSSVHGSGFDFVGLREWEAGDRFSSIDWAQSSINNFAPLIVRDFDQPSTASVVAVADGSLSTRCGVDGLPIAAAIARAIATIGMSAVFFQDTFGLITVDEGFGHFEAVRPRIGKGQVTHCLDAYQYPGAGQEIPRSGSISQTLSGFLRKTSMLPVISDFLIDEPAALLRELAALDTTHDVFLVIVDATFAYEMPPISAGWVEAFDVESGRSRLMSRGTLRRMAARVAAWQDEVARLARDQDLDVVRLGRDQAQADLALTEFAVERRLRKVR